MLSMAEEEDEEVSTAKGPHSAVSRSRQGDGHNGGDGGHASDAVGSDASGAGAATTGTMMTKMGDTSGHGVYGDMINDEDSESDSDGAGSDDGSNFDSDDGYTNATTDSGMGREKSSDNSCDNVTAATDREHASQREEETHTTVTSSARDLSPRSNHSRFLVLASDDAATAVAIADRVLGLTQPVAYVELGGARGLGSVEPPPVNEPSGEPRSPPHHHLKTPLSGSSIAHNSIADDTSSDNGDARSMDNDASTSTGSAAAITSSGLGSSSGVDVEKSEAANVGATPDRNTAELFESSQVNPHEPAVDANSDITASPSSAARAAAASAASASVPPPEPRVVSPGAPRPLTPIAKRMLRDGFITKGE